MSGMAKGWWFTGAGLVLLGYSINGVFGAAVGSFLAGIILSAVDRISEAQIRGYLYRRSEAAQ